MTHHIFYSTTSHILVSKQIRPLCSIWCHRICKFQIINWHAPRIWMSSPVVDKLTGYTTLCIRHLFPNSSIPLWRFRAAYQVIWRYVMGCLASAEACISSYKTLISITVLADQFQINRIYQALPFSGSWLTCPKIKWPTFIRRYFHMHFLQWEVCVLIIFIKKISGVFCMWQNTWNHFKRLVFVIKILAILIFLFISVLIFTNTIPLSYSNTPPWLIA